MCDSKDSAKSFPVTERHVEHMSDNISISSAESKTDSPVRRHLDFKAEGKSPSDESNFLEEPEVSAKEGATISGGYEQVYTILKSTESSLSTGKQSNEVLFRCGNWCYRGHVQFGDLKLETGDIPAIIPCLQRQQSTLRYFCKANDIPTISPFHDPVNLFNVAREFCATEIVSDRMTHELQKWSITYPWIEDDHGKYFELSFEHTNSLANVAMICSKTYYRGLILISIYCDKSLYFVVQDGEGEQALLDIRFPDVSKCGQGLHLSVYNNENMPWNKLVLWRTLDEGGRHVVNIDSDHSQVKKLERPISSCTYSNLASSEYEQTYCVMKGTVNTHSSISLQKMHRDVFFRFGSWCYAGRVQLVPSLALSDIPFLIPALRIQQSKLDFHCESRSVPTNSPFHGVLEYIKKITPKIESLIVSSEDSLKTLIDGLAKNGLADSVKKWLEGDSMNSFFEFKCTPSEATEDIFKDMDVVVSKTYYASGIITIMIVYEHTYYISMSDSEGENPLLDSKFPDVSGKGRGYQLQTYPEGVDGWSDLRKVSIWQTADALQEEFRGRKASTLAEAKPTEGREGNNNGRKQTSDPQNNYVDENYRSDEIDTKAVIDSLVGSSLSSSDGRRQGVDNLVPSTSTRGGKLSINTLPISPKRATSSGSAEHKGYTAEMYANSPARDRAGSEDFNSRSRSNSTDFHMLTPSSRGHSFAEAKMNSVIVETSELHHDCDYDNETPAVSARGEQHFEEKDYKDNNRVLEKKISINVARPHHLPKLESLSIKMEEIRRNMLTEGVDSDAPWDTSGKPKPKKKKRDKKKEKDHEDYQNYVSDIPGHSGGSNKQRETHHTFADNTTNSEPDNRKKFMITNVNGKYIIESPDSK